MTYERLTNEGRIKGYAAKPDEIKQLIAIANRDLQVASVNLEIDADWTYSMAYNAVLQISRALMLKLGYRPRGADQHATVVEFVRIALGTDFSEKVILFDQMRRKRNRVVYEVSGIVSKDEVEQVIKFAREYVAIITVVITGQAKLSGDKE